MISPMKILILLVSTLIWSASLTAQDAKLVILNLETESGLFDRDLYKKQSKLLMETIIENSENVVLLIPERSKSHLAYGASNCQMLLDSVYRFQAMTESPDWNKQLVNLLKFHGTESCIGAKNSIEVYVVNTMNNITVELKSKDYMRDIVLLLNLAKEGAIMENHIAEIILGFGHPEQKELRIENILSTEQND
jgi:hypothetical protein